MSSSVHIDNKEKCILTFSEGSKQGLDDSRGKYPISFTQSDKRLHYKKYIKLY